MLRPPTSEEGLLMADDSLWRFYKTTVGLSLMKLDGVWFTGYISSYPDLTVLQNYYRGGYVHTISQSVRDELVAAGYGAYIT
jgi:hypothetical protein